MIAMRCKWLRSLTYDQIFVRHNQQPNCNCNDCEQLLCHQIINHFRMFPMLMCHWCIRKIDRNCLDERRPKTKFKRLNWWKLFSKIAKLTCSPNGSGQFGAAAPCAENKFTFISRFYSITKNTKRSRLF